MLMFDLNRYRNCFISWNFVTQPTFVPQQSAMHIKHVPYQIRVQETINLAYLKPEHKKLDDKAVTFSPLKGDLNLCMYEYNWATLNWTALLFI